MQQHRGLSAAHYYNTRFSPMAPHRDVIALDGPLWSLTFTLLGRSINSPLRSNMPIKSRQQQLHRLETQPSLKLCVLTKIVPRSFPYLKKETKSPSEMSKGPSLSQNPNASILTSQGEGVSS